MAQALSIVGEAGIHGMDHRGLISRILASSNTKQSKKMRWSLVSAHEFGEQEFEDYLILAWRFGFVTRSNYYEYEETAGKDKSAYTSLDDDVVRLTREGWEFIEVNDRPLLHRWGAYLAESFPTVIISVLAAIATSWAVSKWGAPN